MLKFFAFILLSISLNVYATTYTDNDMMKGKSVVVIKEKNKRPPLPTWESIPSIKPNSKKSIHVSGHWRETAKGRVWVNSHYRSRQHKK